MTTLLIITSCLFAVAAAVYAGRRINDAGFKEGMDAAMRTIKKVEYHPGKPAIPGSLGISLYRERVIHALVMDLIKTELVAGRMNKGKTLVDLWDTEELKTIGERLFAIYLYTNLNYLSCTFAQHPINVLQVIKEAIKLAGPSEKLSIVKTIVRTMEAEDKLDIRASDSANELMDMVHRGTSTDSDKVIKGVTINVSGMTPEERRAAIQKAVSEMEDVISKDVEERYGDKKEKKEEPKKDEVVSEDSTVAKL